MHVHIHVRMMMMMMMMMMIDGRQTQDLELIVRSCGSSEVHLRKHYCPRGLVIIVTIEAESDDDPAMASSDRQIRNDIINGLWWGMLYIRALLLLLRVFKRASTPRLLSQ
ncbi:uncharacterized protein K489DRAFT_69835 [Dissoconium aciculare CBS 342.82]|uniref:Secreted protein n=1 Tax=Dissoconium aciculare CBS 342.82 TaxID=1314786 RepID=A0A6J3LV90_9PEZI|nr:uncharacterized protein K489DRAFT_69835 [Dissoconium aciculare CBS 342.82]KAF1819583.1 hypothetical protein K489DRAFT_69835 [Dissoconium aciculare CBS 342.82]